MRRSLHLSHEQLEPRRYLCVTFAEDAGFGGDGLEPWHVLAADLDQDGDMDVVYSSLTTGIGWFENDGWGDLNGPWTISSDDKPRFVQAVDLDGDGDLDVLAESGWYENFDGKRDFDPRKSLRTLSGSIHGTDVDGDGDVDVRAVVDIDGDGDVDIVTRIRDRVQWYENVDGEGAFDNPRTIVFTGSLAGIDVEDVDGDGDVDVLVASYWRGLTWHENLDGRGTFGQQATIDSMAWGVGSVHAADLDGDGDADVLSADYGNGRITWYENTDGKANLVVQQTIATEGEEPEERRSATSVYAADMDGDGDLDVISAGYGIDSISWHRNLSGEPRFGDANRDGRFDQLDLVQVLQAGKYLTGQAATFAEGDWNVDGVFDQLDFILALQPGSYLRGSLCQ